VESVLNSEKINAGRQFEVDCVKFFAIPFMVCIHFYEQFGAYDFVNDIPNTVFRNMIEFVGGPLAAPVFMFCMGIGMIYTKHSSSSDFKRRGVKLLITGYALNFFRQTLLQLVGMIMGIETDIDIIGGLLCVDILPFAGMAFLFIGLMKRYKFSIIRMCEMAFLMQAVGIWATKLHMKPGVFQNLFGLIVPTGKWTSFPLTLWIVYPAFGMLFGKYLEKCEDKNQMYRKLIILSMVFFAVYTVGLLYIGFDIRENFALYKDSYYHHNIISTLWTLPIIILALSICHFLFSKLEQTKFGEFIRYLSENLNTIYIIQWLIIAYSVAISILLGIDKTYSPIIIIIGGIIVTFVAVIISIPFVRIKRNRKLKAN
jgi:hypothetical protein